MLRHSYFFELLQDAIGLDDTTLKHEEDIISQMPPYSLVAGKTGMTLLREIWDFYVMSGEQTGGGFLPGWWNSLSLLCLAVSLFALGGVLGGMRFSGIHIYQRKR